jgi:hypothetical protein
MSKFSLDDLKDYDLFLLEYWGISYERGSTDTGILIEKLLSLDSLSIDEEEEFWKNSSNKLNKSSKEYYKTNIIIKLLKQTKNKFLSDFVKKYKNKAKLLDFDLDLKNIKVEFSNSLIKNFNFNHITNFQKACLNKENLGGDFHFFLSNRILDMSKIKKKFFTEGGFGGEVVGHIFIDNLYFDNEDIFAVDCGGIYVLSSIKKLKDNSKKKLKLGDFVSGKDCHIDDLFVGL